MKVGRLLLGAALLAVLATAGGGWRQPAKAAAAAASPEVEVATPSVETVPDTATYPAHLEAVERVEIRPRLTGHLESLHFEDGARVGKGQLLARIDARPFRVALAEAEANLRRTRADADRARRDSERAARLFERKATSEEDTEHRRSAAEVAAAQVAAAEAAVGRARLDLGYTELRAPVAGRLGRAEVTAGNLVGPDTRIGVLVALDPLYARFDLDETTAARHGGATWTTHLHVGRESSVPSRLAFLDPEVAPGTGTRRARAIVANPGGTLVPGMYGRMEVVFGEHAGALLVEETVVGTDQGQRFVLVVGANDTLEYRPVRLGARQGSRRVVNEGLAPTDRVVVNGLAKVRPGMLVRPVAASSRKAD